MTYTQHIDLFQPGLALCLRTKPFPPTRSTPTVRLCKILQVLPGKIMLQFN